MARTKWYGAVLLGCLFFGMVSGAVIFSDDFSNCAQSSQNWVAPAASTTTTATCGSGVYVIANTSTSYAALMMHEFPAPKPAVFTISGKITGSSGSNSSGLWVCFNKNDNSGYLLQMNPSTSQSVQFNKYRASALTDTSFVIQSAFIVQGTNVLKISKKNDSITMFCNNGYIGTFVDRAPIASGDLTLLVSPNSTVNFDDITVTDEWTPPPAATNCFKDEFNDDAITGWLDLSQNDQKQESDGYLQLTTTANTTSFADLWVRIDQLKLDTFVTKAYVSHRSGNKVNMYGIFYCGEAVGGIVPMAYFSINASKQYDAYIDVISPVASTFIHGAAYETTYFTDTIEVVKKLNAPYKMYVNGQYLDSLPASKITFDVIGAGINVDNGMVVWVDYFQHGPNANPCPVINPTKVRPLLSYGTFSPYKSNYLFDPMGRIIRTKRVSGQAFIRMVPGYYIMPNGKNGVVIKK